MVECLDIINVSMTVAITGLGIGGLVAMAFLVGLEYRRYRDEKDNHANRNP